MFQLTDFWLAFMPISDLDNTDDKKEWGKYDFIAIAIVITSFSNIVQP